jgi:hypothetical protein
MNLEFGPSNSGSVPFPVDSPHPVHYLGCEKNYLAIISARIRNWIRTIFLFFFWGKMLNFSLKIKSFVYHQISMLHLPTTTTNTNFEISRP